MNERKEMKMDSPIELRKEMQKELDELNSVIPKLEFAVRSMMNEDNVDALHGAYQRRTELKAALIIMGQFER